MPHVNLVRPRINHLAFTVSRDALDDTGRKRIVDFFSECFGFRESTPPEYRSTILSMSLGANEVSTYDPDNLYMVLIATDKPYTANPGNFGDHFGMTIGSRAEYNSLLATAQEYVSRNPEVELTDIDTIKDDEGTLDRFYLRFGTPLACEIQYFQPA